MKSGKERLAELRARRRKEGLRPFEVWMTAAEHKWFVAALAKRREKK